jgi:hypothetical protein
MPLTVLDCKGISATRRERIEAAVEAGGKHFAQPYEGWIAVNPVQGGVRLLITGPQGGGDAGESGMPGVEALAAGVATVGPVADEPHQDIAIPHRRP